jgi:prepilin-type N-terminal cleavage/methylation domain-containing protein
MPRHQATCFPSPTLGCAHGLHLSTRAHPPTRSRTHPHARVRRSAGGFTLVELLVSLLLFAVLALMLHEFTSAMLRGVALQQATAEAQEAAHIGVQLISRDLRGAGYRPRGGGTGIQSADSHAVAVASDFNGDGDVDDANEQVAYAFDAQARTLTRALGGSSPQPMLDHLAADGLELRFTAADGTAVVGDDGLTADQRAQVRAVEVALTIEIPNPDPRQTRPIRVRESTTVALRNG